MGFVVYGLVVCISRERFAFHIMRRQVTQSPGIAPPSAASAAAAAAAADVHDDIQISIEADGDEVHTPSRYGV